ncbi:TUS1 [Candida oxycetoniae]|uniref:TUS1 n=1 Tax=Candida oxycetoniae TaxID=497107 RepID=A0AAI9WZG9_9ASCO|nr:TUS1 [Candida oxycetoniae]KAI3406352.2 TUS1 [Candida oxycetoniae]
MSKKLPRRKPPPSDFEATTSTLNSEFGPLPSISSNKNHIAEDSVTPATIIRRHNQSSSSSSLPPLQQQQQQTPPSKFLHSPPALYNQMHYFQTSAAAAAAATTKKEPEESSDYLFDESFASVDSTTTRPKGPKDIWEYDTCDKIDSPLNASNSATHANIQINRTLPQRSYQHMSRSSTVPKSNSTNTIMISSSSLSSPPYPISINEVKTPERSLPYPISPIEDFLQEEIEFMDSIDNGYAIDIDSPSQRRTRAIIEQSVTTSSPRINDVPNLSTSSSLSTFHAIQQHHHQQQQQQQPQCYYSSSPNFDSSSPLSGHIPRDNLSVHLQSNFTVSDAYSRSPSSRKSIHSMTDSTSSVYHSPYNIVDNADDPLEQYPSSPQYLQPRHSYRVVSDNPFFDDEGDVTRNEFESPATEYFDYNILPELPQSKDSTPSLPPVPRSKKEQELPPLPSPLPLDLPQLPFTSATLQAQHFEICSNIWSLSQLFKWSCKLQYWLKNSTVSKSELRKAIIRLFAFHRSDVPLDLVTRCSSAAFNTFVQTGAIEVVELQTANTDGERSVVLFHETIYVNGVLPGLTDCYSPVPHFKDEEIACYASSCQFSRMKNLERKMRNMNVKDIVLANDWATHWRLTIEDLRDIDPTMIKRQSLIFDLLRYEQTFIQRAKCFVEIVGPEFIKAAKNFTNNLSRIKEFEEDVLQTGKKIVQIHQGFLFEPLLKVLIAEGKFIKSIIEIVNIYTDWAKEVRPFLMKYMNNMPMIEDLLRIPNLKAYVDDHIGNLPRVRELKVNVPILFISTFNSRYQQIPLQLLDIQKKYQENEPEHFLLQQASDEIKKLGSKINDSKKFADNVHAIGQIKSQLSWKSNLRQVNLNLNSINRKFICRGDLTRKSDLKITTQVNHIILLDNFLLITERLKNPKSPGAHYKIIEDPIPIDFLIFEEKVTSSTVSSTKLAASSPHIQQQQQLQLQQQQQQQQTQLDDDVSVQYAVKLRYAGKTKHSYTYSCRTEREKDDWINYLSTAKTNMCKRLYSSAAYVTHSISNTCFAYDQNNRILKLQVVVPFDPICNICLDTLKKMKLIGMPKDIYNPNIPRSRVTYGTIRCCVTFIYKDLKFTLVGLSNGLYCCESKSRWKKVMNGSDFTKIHVDVNTGLVIILNDRYLKYYLIHQIINVYTETSTVLTGTLLSKDPVLFFAVVNHRNVTMLFLAKRRGSLTNFKVLIPETENNGVFSRFKDDRKFYIEAECYGISVFNSSFAVHTDKGFEILELDKLIPRSVPELPQPDPDISTPKKKIDQLSRKSSSTPTNGTSSSNAATAENIRKLVSSSHMMPLGMFKLSNNSEFLLVYDKFAIFINKHGKLSRYAILLFDFKAKAVHFKQNNLFIIKDDVLEILSISNLPKGSNKFIQVITGKDIRLVSSPESNDVTIAMANPLVPGLQLLFNLVPPDFDQVNA